MPPEQAPRRRRLRDLPLVWRVFAVNAGVLLAASGVLLFTPVTVSSPVSAREFGTICAGLLVMLVVNLVLLRRTFEPLGRVARQMEHVDLLRPGSVRVDEPLDREIAALARSFNAMLARLEDERRAGAERSVLALEGERRRVARELHDEVGQALTGMLLHLERAARGATGASVAEIEAAREAARHALEDVRRIAQQLRPEVLDDLGLASALRSLCGAVSRAADIRVACDLDDDLPALSHDAELVIYRIAQESLTNVARHAGAANVEVTLRRTTPGVALTVRDDGTGLRANRVRLAGGIRGMRERAVLVDGELSIATTPDGGTLVHLEVPAG